MTRDETRVTLFVTRWFARVEDVVYVALSVLLVGVAIGLLVDGTATFVRAVAARDIVAQVPTLLDRLLLVLMVVEILYTVQISLREHTLVPEPFLVVALIAGVRRILVLTAEFSELIKEGGPAFRNGMIELSVLTAMVLAIVAALVLLRRVVRRGAVSEPLDEGR